MTSDASSAARNKPGQVRDAVIAVLSTSADSVISLAGIHERTETMLGHSVSASSVRSFLNLNEGDTVVRVSRGHYALAERQKASEQAVFKYNSTQMFQDDCLSWLGRQPSNSIHAVVTDPPYGAAEYTAKEQSKLRDGSGGIWRIPPTLNGVKRAPVPRFTTLSDGDLVYVDEFFAEWASQLIRVLVPGANVVVAANPLISHVVSSGLARGGLERRGELIRLVQTLRGGDRPKGAHQEFADVTVMPRSQWEPWLLYRKPLEGTVAQNLRKWGTGGFRRISDARPFGDVLKGAPARNRERAIAPHPSLKPQSFLRKVVRASLPVGKGIILDPFAGSGSTLAAAEAVGYQSIGVERDSSYIEVARDAIPGLSRLKISADSE